VGDAGVGAGANLFRMGWILLARTRIGLSVLTAIACLGLGAPAFADTPTTTLKVDAAFDRTEYASGSFVKLKVTITNTGDAPAEKVIGLFNYPPTTFAANVSDWGDLASGKGAEILPGETRVVNLAGYLYQPVDAVVAQARILSPNRPFQTEPDFSLNAPVHTATGGWGGHIYGDANQNGTPDVGEGLAAVKVHLSGGVPWAEHITTTDTTGEFSYTNVPTGQYAVYYDLPGGWVLDHRDSNVVVTEGTPGTVTVKAVRPLSDRLHVTVKFARNTYQVGDTVKAKVTLTNSGSTAISGIVSHCNGIGNDNQIGSGPSWGPLAYNSSGVTVAPGKKAVVNVTDVVPAAAANWGEVVASCAFGPVDGDPEGYPFAGDQARVPVSTPTPTYGSCGTRTEPRSPGSGSGSSTRTPTGSSLAG
jgi:hypothetical protein